MFCLKIQYQQEPYYTPMLLLRQQELRAPLGLNLFDENLSLEISQYFFVGIIDEKVISCLMLEKKSNSIFKLRQMATANKFQSKGYGKALVIFAEQWAKENGVEKIILHARKEAINFYEKMNYTIDGNVFFEVGIPHFLMFKYLV